MSGVMQMNMTSFLQDKRLTIALKGDIDHHSAKDTMRIIGNKIDLYLPMVCVLDFRDVTFMDSSGIAIVIHAIRRMRELRGVVVSLLVGVFLGICSSFLGIGGGPINVALIIYLFSFDTKTATVCSLVTILFAQISKLATVALTTGFAVFDLSIAPVMIVGAIAGGFIGASLNKKCSEAAVEKAFNAVQLVVLAIAVFNIVRNLMA